MACLKIVCCSDKSGRGGEMKMYTKMCFCLLFFLARHVNSSNCRLVILFIWHGTGGTSAEY